MQVVGRGDEHGRQVAAEESERARRDVLAAVIEAQESERARVSRDLHDDIGARLLASKMSEKLGAITQRNPASASA